MEGGSSSETLDMSRRTKGNQNLCPKIDPFVPKRDHDPKELKSWAKRTGFVSTFSSEIGSATNNVNENKRNGTSAAGNDLNSRGGSLSPKIGIDPLLGRARDNRGLEIESDRAGSSGPGLEPIGEGHINLRDGVVRVENKGIRFGDEIVAGRRDVDGGVNVNNENGRAHEIFDNRNGQQVPVAVDVKKDDSKEEGGVGIDVYPDDKQPAHGGWDSSPRMKYGPTDNPGFVPLLYYGLQHYLSLAGSLIFIPLLIVPAMGGTDKDTSIVISTMLLVSGVTTLLHSYLGTRLPLVQGSSFVFLAPALVIVNAKEFRDLTEHKFRYIMRELQGAIIVGSIFQCFLGFSGLMSLLLRFVNPIVIAPTVAAVGLAFFSYGFPQAASCVEISIPQILLVLIFTLYLRGISIAGHRVFLIYAVPLSVFIIWTYAFFLTAGGAYNYRGCRPDIPSSNILFDACQRHVYTMKHCRTDVSNAWTTADWVRVPYPLQWGIPIFHLRTTIIMVIVSLVASIDSVGTYYSVSLKVNLKPPTPGIVSRGIGLEGFCSILAGLWGSGTGSTTLTENVHTIDVTKVASQRAIELGAVLLIFFSFIGKVGAILASIPQALAAGVLCFMWTLMVALGLSFLQYSEAARFRNITIVAVSLFLGFSIPAYFQQYQPDTSSVLPGYFVPYAAASNGPIHSGAKQFDFALNALLSMNMVVTLLVAMVLDTTVPGKRQERGVYAWSNAEDIESDPSLLAPYSMPRKVAGFCGWAKCLCR